LNEVRVFETPASVLSVIVGVPIVITLMPALTALWTTRPRPVTCPRDGRAAVVEPTRISAILAEYETPDRLVVGRCSLLPPGPDGCDHACLRTRR
jgi:hypothetical protein